MDRPFLVRLADVVMFFAFAYLLISLTDSAMARLGSMPGPNGWVAMAVIGFVAIYCAIKIQLITQILVDIVLLPFRRIKK